MTELKPCPFCGSKVRFNYDGNFEPNGIWCSKCHMLAKFSRIHVKRGETFEFAMNEMAEAWNQRVGDHS